MTCLDFYDHDGPLEVDKWLYPHDRNNAVQEPDLCIKLQRAKFEINLWCNSVPELDILIDTFIDARRWLLQQDKLYTMAKQEEAEVEG